VRERVCVCVWRFSMSLMMRIMCARARTRVCVCVEDQGHFTRFLSLRQVVYHDKPVYSSHNPGKRD
jgi:hypothetical protein